VLQGQVRGLCRHCIKLLHTVKKLSPLATQVFPLLPPSKNQIIAAIQADKYYQLLIPLTVPVTIFAVCGAVILGSARELLQNSEMLSPSSIAGTLMRLYLVHADSPQLAQHEAI
jgi:hypothetical protein